MNSEYIASVLVCVYHPNNNSKCKPEHLGQSGLLYCNVVHAYRKIIKLNERKKDGWIETKNE